MAAVFLSYSHEDAAIAAEVAAVLDRLQIDYFQDTKHVGWGAAITSTVRLAVRKCRAVIVILSPGSLKSAWVPYELGQASAIDKKILPYLTHPSLEVPAYIRDLNYSTTIEQVTERLTELMPELATAAQPSIEESAFFVPAGTVVRNSEYKFANVIDDQCKTIIITGHNFADLLGTRPNPPSPFHQLIVRTLQGAIHPHVTLAFAPPAALKVSHTQGFNDLIENSMPRLLDLQNTPELSEEARERLTIIEHSGALSMQCFVRDPDDEARALIVATPRWFTDDQSLSRFYFAVHHSQSPELFHSLFSVIHTHLRRRDLYRTLDEVAKEYGVT